LLKQALQSQPGILGVTAAAIGLGSGEGQEGGRLEFDGKKNFAMWFRVDNNYLNLMGVQLVAGRDLTTASNPNVAIGNEALVQEVYGIPPAQAIGKQIGGFRGDSSFKTIIGVARNMHFEDLSRTVRPQVYFPEESLDPSRFYIRLTGGNPTAQLAAIEAAWKKLAPGLPFEYSFLDEKFDDFYKSETRWSAIVGCAGGISIFLACLGLFGLAALAVVNRTREIGIRKVLGATVTQIAGLLSKDFVRLIVIALLVASPLAWYVMNDWLQSYAYRIHISLLVFVLAGIFAVGIALFTVSVQAIKAAVMNPVKSLRTE
jgi:putative ABC transport system permease protein